VAPVFLAVVYGKPEKPRAASSVDRNWTALCYL